MSIPNEVDGKKGNEELHVPGPLVQPHQRGHVPTCCPGQERKGSDRRGKDSGIDTFTKPTETST